MSTLKILVAVAASFASAAALAVDARERGFIRLGMAEGEVVFRIGKPDHEAFVADAKGQPKRRPGPTSRIRAIRRRSPSSPCGPAW